MERPGLATEAFLLWPAALLFSGVARLRGVAYDRSLLPVMKSSVPIVSIGNITAGGTGKTPLVAWLVEQLLLQGKTVGVVSRGYGRKSKGCQRVKSDGSRLSALEFGDEPSWLAAKFPNVPVYVSSDRVEAVRRLRSENEIDLVIADDAFQHRRMKRDLDVVILDATEPRWHYRPLPLGRAREGFEALARANRIFLTKTNLVDPAQVDWLRARIEEACGPGVARTMHEFESRIEGFVRAGAAAGAGLTASASASEARLRQSASEVRLCQSASLVRLDESKRVLLVSGIGRPKTFERLVIDASPKLEILDHLVYADHHAYSSEDLARIEARAKDLRAEAVLVTEKDSQKLGDWQPAPEVWVSRLVTKPKTGMEEFHEAVDRLVL